MKRYFLLFAIVFMGIIMIGQAQSLEWSHTENHAWTDGATGITTDGAGQVYIGGNFINAGHSGYFSGQSFFRKYSADGRLLLEKKPSTSYSFHIMKMKYVDHKIYAVVGLWGSYDMDSEYRSGEGTLLCCMDTAFNTRWVRFMNRVYTGSVDITPEGDAYVLCKVADSVSFENRKLMDYGDIALLYKVNASGNLAWYKKVKGSLRDGMLKVNGNRVGMFTYMHDSLHIDSVHAYNTAGDYWSGCMVMADTSGKVLNMSPVNGLNYRSNMILDWTSAGECSLLESSRTWYKYDPGGNLLSQNPLHLQESLAGMEVEPSGRIFYASAQRIVGEMSAGGDPLWSMPQGSMASSVFTVFKDSKLYCTGGFTGTQSFGTIPPDSVPMYFEHNTYDFYILSLDLTKNKIQALAKSAVYCNHGTASIGLRSSGTFGPLNSFYVQMSTLSGGFSDWHTVPCTFNSSANAFSVDISSQSRFEEFKFRINSTSPALEGWPQEGVVRIDNKVHPRLVSTFDCKDNYYTLKALNNGYQDARWVSDSSFIENDYDPSQIYVYGPGKYYLVYTNGCGSDSVAVSLDSTGFRYATFSMPGRVCLEDPGFMLWNGIPSGGHYSGPGVKNNVFTPREAGAGDHEIRYVAYDSSGCKYSGSRTVQVASCTTTAVKETPETGMRLYPNPGKGDLTLEIPQAPLGLQLKIMNTLGQEVYSQVLDQEKNRINLEALEKGVYIVQVSGSIHLVKKIVLH